MFHETAYSARVMPYKYSRAVAAGVGNSGGFTAHTDYKTRVKPQRPTEDPAKGSGTRN